MRKLWHLCIVVMFAIVSLVDSSPPEHIAAHLSDHGIKLFNHVSPTKVHANGYNVVRYGTPDNCGMFCIEHTTNWGRKKRYVVRRRLEPMAKKLNIVDF